MDDFTKYITVWECRSVDGKQVARVIHPLYPDDHKYPNEYQRIVFRGDSREYITVS